MKLVGRWICDDANRYAGSEGRSYNFRQRPLQKPIEQRHRLFPGSQEAHECFYTQCFAVSSMAVDKDAPFPWDFVSDVPVLGVKES